MTRQVLQAEFPLGQEEARELCERLGFDPALVVSVLWEPNKVTVSYLEPKRTRRYHHHPHHACAACGQNWEHADDCQAMTQRTKPNRQESISGGSRRDMERKP